MNTRQLAAVLVAPGHQGQFTLQRDRVGNQSAAGFERCPASVQHAFAGDPAPDENRIRTFKPCQCLRRTAADQLQAGHAEGVTVVLDQLLAAVIGFDGKRPATGVGTHPFDTDRTGAGADVPQEFPRGRGEAGEGDGAHVAFGQLAVVLEGRVGQAGQA
ncbi:hypothetical protein D3C79_892530 [compost metagenome]